MLMMRAGEENEEKQLFISNLPSTLEALCTMQGVPQDDTILHRLLDLIKQLVTLPDDASSCGLFSFSDSVIERVNDLNASVVVLALGVAAHLVSMPTLTCDQWQKVKSLYDIVQSSAAVKNSSVGAAYYSSLVAVVGYPAGFEWLQKSNTHLQSALATLETAQSIFVLKAAENFIVENVLTTFKFYKAAFTHTPPPSAMIIETLQFLSNAMTEMMQERSSLLDHMIVSSHISTFHQSAANVVAQLSSSEQFCEWKACDEKLVVTLARVALQHSSEKIRASALQSVVNLVAFMAKDAKEEIVMKEIVSPLLRLVSEGEVERRIAVAAAFVKQSQDTTDSEALSTLQALYRMPHDLVFSREIHHTKLSGLVSIITAALCGRQSFSRLTPSLLHFVKQTVNTGGLVRLVQCASSTRNDEDWSSLLSSWPQGVGAVVMGNQRLLNSLLHLLQQDDCPELTLGQSADILKCLSHIMKRPLVESRLYSQTCAAFLNILRKKCKDMGLEETSEIHEVLHRHMMGLLQRCLVAVQWEVRDTTLEFVRDMISILPDSWLQSQMVEHQLLCDAWSCVKDGESYPRASAITLATSLIQLQDWWKAFLQDTKETEASLVDNMVELLSSDTEAFPRRAAVRLLTAIYFSSSQSHAHQSDIASQKSKIHSAMTSAMDDFDWEVKTTVLDFWELMATPLLSKGQHIKNDVDQENGQRNGSCDGVLGHGSGDSRNSQTISGKHKCTEDRGEGHHVELDSLLQCGFGKAVLAGAEDYDTAVRQKALKILATVLQQAKLNHSPAKRRKLQGRIPESQTSNTRPEGDKETNGELSAVSATNQVSSDPVDQFLQKVAQLNPSHLLHQLGASADEYDRRPSSLLEDVKAAAKVASTVTEVTLMSEDEFEDADDMFVDCY